MLGKRWFGLDGSYEWVNGFYSVTESWRQKLLGAESLARERLGSSVAAKAECRSTSKGWVISLCRHTLIGPTNLRIESAIKQCLRAMPGPSQLPPPACTLLRKLL